MCKLLRNCCVVFFVSILSVNGYAQPYATICEGDPAVALPSITGETVEWRDNDGNLLTKLDAATGVPVPDVAPSVSPTQTTTYTVTYVDASAGNLIPNPGFEGMSDAEKQAGFSAYQYLPDYDPTITNPALGRGPGTYGIGTSPENMFPGDLNLVDATKPSTEVYKDAWYDDIPHRSAGGTEMFYADGNNKANVTVFSTTVNVTPGTDYVLAGWFANIHKEKYSPFQMQFRINSQDAGYFEGHVVGVKKNVSVYNEATGAYELKDVDVGIGGWYQYHTVWNSGTTSGPVSVEIVNKNTFNLGNDFAIDDLLFVPVKKQQYEIVVNPRPTPLIQDVTTCVGATLDIGGASPTGNTPVYSWIDSNDAGKWGSKASTHGILSNPGDNVAVQSISTTTFGTYFIGLNITDANGCSIDSVITVDIEARINIPMANDPVCQGEPYVLQPEIGTRNLTYRWADPMQKLSDVNILQPTFDTSEDDVYSVELYVEEVGTGCTGGTGPINITVNEKPTISLAPQYVCEGQSLQLQPQVLGGTGPGTYSGFTWVDTNVPSVLQSTNILNPQIETNLIPTETEPGVVGTPYLLSFSLSDGNGCVGSMDDIVVHVYENPKVVLTNQMACSQDTRTISSDVIDGATHVYDRVTWLGDASLLLSRTDVLDAQLNGTAISNTIPYRLGLEVEDEFGCIGRFENMELLINSNPAPVISIDQTTRCEGAQLQLNPLINGGTPAFIHEWVDVNGILDDVNVQNPIVNTDQVNSNGHALVYRVTDALGCIGISKTEVFINPNPLVQSVDAPAVCQGEVLTLSPVVNGNARPFQFQWLGGGNAYLSATDEEYPVVDTNVPVNASVDLEVTDALGCVSMLSNIPIIVNALPDVILPPDPPFVCDANSITIVPAFLSDDVISYTWTTSNGSFSSHQISGEFEGNVALQVANANGCTAQDEMEVNVAYEPLFDPISSAFGCEGEVFVFDANKGNDIDIASYNWFRWSGDGYVEIGHTEPTLEITEAGHYRVEIETADGCFVLNDEADVQVFSKPEIISVDQSVYKEITLTASNSIEPYEYAVNYQNFTANNNFKGLDNGDYFFRVRDKLGCQTDTILTVNNEVDVFVPNYFTPNGDGYNEHWVIEGLERLPNTEIIVYNRFGKIVHKAFAYEGFWDGKYNGRILSTDTYWYVIKLDLFDQIIMGMVTIRH